MNLRAAKLKNYSSADDREIPGMGGRKVRDIDQLLDTDSLQATQINESFCLRWKNSEGEAVPVDPRVKYDCRVNSFIIPRHVYRIPNITREGIDNPATNELLKLPANEGSHPFVHAGEVLLLGEAEPFDPKDPPTVYRTTFAKKHLCQRSQADAKKVDPDTEREQPAEIGENCEIEYRTGGGTRPCTTIRRVLRSNADYEYVALLWDWKRTYEEFSQDEKDSYLRKIYASLKNVFGGKSPIPVVLLEAPDGATLFCPVFLEDRNKLNDLHDLLKESVKSDADFETDTFDFMDGPDVIVAEIGFGKNNRRQLTTSPAQA